MFAICVDENGNDVGIRTDDIIGDDIVGRGKWLDDDIIEDGDDNNVDDIIRVVFNGNILDNGNLCDGIAVSGEHGCDNDVIVVNDNDEIGAYVPWVDDNNGNDDNEDDRKEFKVVEIEYDDIDTKAGVFGEIVLVELDAGINVDNANVEFNDGCTKGDNDNGDCSINCVDCNGNKFGFVWTRLLNVSVGTMAPTCEEEDVLKSEKLFDTSFGVTRIRFVCEPVEINSRVGVISLNVETSDSSINVDVWGEDIIGNGLSFDEVTVWMSGVRIE